LNLSVSLEHAGLSISDEVLVSTFCKVSALKIIVSTMSLV